MRVIVTGHGPAPESFGVVITYDAHSRPVAVEVKGWWGAFATLEGPDSGATPVS